MTEQYDFKYRQEICFHPHSVKSKPSTPCIEISPEPLVPNRDQPTTCFTQDPPALFAATEIDAVWQSETNLATIPYPLSQLKA